VQTNFIKNLFNLEDVIVKNIKNLKEKVEIYIELPVVEHLCPHCGAETTKIHDYRPQPIVDIPIYFKPTKIIYNKRRYECKNCCKSFYENNSIVNKYSRKSIRLTEFIVEQLRKLTPCSDIANMCGISAGYISRLFPYLAITPTHLPRVLCIDEFKGNAGKYKYQVALIDGETHEVVDILKCRYKHFLCDYFKKFSQSERDNVKYFVTDLWETYKDIAFTYFRKAKIVADHFHFARYACDVVNKIRINVQDNLPKKEKIYFKHSRKLLLSRSCNLSTDEQRDELTFILTNYSENLRIAYREKEELLDIIHSKESFELKADKFNKWVKYNLESDIPELQECAKTYQHWYCEIKNSLEVPYSNGPTEGFNNKIKVLKRISFGVRNFTNFKARIMLLNRN
jgi:transposase